MIYFITLLVTEKKGLTAILTSHHSSDNGTVYLVFADESQFEQALASGEFARKLVELGVGSEA